VGGGWGGWGGGGGGGGGGGEKNPGKFFFFFLPPDGRLLARDFGASCFLLSRGQQGTHNMLGVTLQRGPVGRIRFRFAIGRPRTDFVNTAHRGALVVLIVDDKRAVRRGQ